MPLFLQTKSSHVKSQVNTEWLCIVAEDSYHCRASVLVPPVHASDFILLFGMHLLAGRRPQDTESASELELV